MTAPPRRPARRLHPRTVAARHVVAAVDRAVRDGRLRRRSPPAGRASRRPSRRRGRTPTRIAGHGIDEVTDALRRRSSTTCRQPPILIGHSFGGMIAEKLLGRGPRRRPRSPSTPHRSRACCRCRCRALRSTLPVFKNPANKHRAVSLTAEQFRYSFGNAIPPEESDAAVRAVDDPRARASRCSRRPRPTSPRTRRRRSTPTTTTAGPLLLVMGGQDHTVPEAITKVDAQAVPALGRASPTCSSSPTGRTR